MVQWLALHVSSARGMGSIPGQGIKIPGDILGCVARPKKKKVQKLCDSVFSLSVCPQLFQRHENPLCQRPTEKRTYLHASKRGMKHPGTLTPPS